MYNTAILRSLDGKLLIFFKFSHGIVEKYTFIVYNVIIGGLPSGDRSERTFVMKDFFKRYSYESVRLFINQVVIGLFGLVLALAAGIAENETLRVVTGIFSVVFFLFMQFASAWRIGAEDRMSVDLGKRKLDLSVPFKVWLLANSLNLILALLIALGVWFGNGGALSSISGGATMIKMIIEGMYTGLLASHVGGAPLNSYWFVHFLTVLPALPAIVAAYICGAKNINFGGLFMPNVKK